MKASALPRPARSSRLPLARSSNRCRSSTPAASKRVALQVQHLPVAVGRDAHVADQHVRKTSPAGFPHSASFRQGLSCSFLAYKPPPQAPLRSQRKSGVSRQLRRQRPGELRVIFGGFPPLARRSVLILSAYAYQEAVSLVPARSVAEPTATPAATFATPSSVSPKRARSSASPSGTSSAPGSVSPAVRPFHTCQTSSAVAASPPDVGSAPSFAPVTWAKPKPLIGLRFSALKVRCKNTGLNQSTGRCSPGPPPPTRWAGWQRS